MLNRVSQAQKGRSWMFSSLNEIKGSFIGTPDQDQNKITIWDLSNSKLS